MPEVCVGADSRPLRLALISVTVRPLVPLFMTLTKLVRVFLCLKFVLGRTRGHSEWR